MSFEYDYPLLSIIVPNYNNSIWLRDCLDSILAQSYRNIEIIVSDDCSTDDSLEIIRSYANQHPKKVKFLYHDMNVGVARNRHSAILMAEGEYITTIDSDDYYYDRDKLKKEMELVVHYKKNFNQDICAYSNTILVNQDKIEIAIRGTNDRLKQGFLLNQFMQRSCEIPINFVLLKELYYKVGGYEHNIPIYEDWDLKIRLSSMIEFYYTGLIGTAYRRHNIGLSSADPMKHIKWLKYVFRKNEYLLNIQERHDVRMRFQEHILKLRKRHFQDMIHTIERNSNNKQYISFIKNWINLYYIDCFFIRPRALYSLFKKSL